jgi:plastocyanin
VQVANGRLANAVVYIKSGLGDRAFAAPQSPVLLDQHGCLYDPHVVALMVGQPLEFRNSDPEAHNVHGRPKDVDAWNFLMSRPGSTRSVTFDKPEVGIPVGCDIHPWMRAYASVFDHPYFAVTPSSGAATLTPVPAGDYVVAVWHETLGTLVQPVSVPAKGTATLQFAFAPAS